MSPEKLSHSKFDHVGTPYVGRDVPEHVNVEIRALVMAFVALAVKLSVGKVSVVTRLMRSDFHTVAGLMKTIVVARKQTDAVEGAAMASGLADHDKVIISHVMGKVRSMDTVRRRYVHYVWACADELPEAVILVDTDVLTDHHAAVTDYLRHGGSLHEFRNTKDAQKRLARAEFDRDRAWVYDRKEIQRHIRDMHKTLNALELLERLVDPNPTTAYLARSELEELLGTEPST